MKETEEKERKIYYITYTLLFDKKDFFSSHTNIIELNI